MSQTTQQKEAGQGLTKEDRQKLARWAKSGINPNSPESEPNLNAPVDEITDIELPWRLNDGRAGVTIEQCNALRCAAQDKLSYSKIASLFSFVGGKSAVRKHVVGDCRHSGGVSPTTNGWQPGPEEGSVSEAECAELRRRWKRGHFGTYREASNWLNRAESAAWRHINGECSHLD